MMNCLQCGKRIRNKRKDAVYCSDLCRVTYNRNKTVTDNPAEKTILSLCDYTGNWCKPYRDAGYNVIQIDMKHGQDVRLLRSQGLVYGILAAPPCTVFCVAGNRWTRTPEEMREALSVVDACLRLVATCRPVFWALENPTGKLKHYLGEPDFRFDPCDYGDPYTKKTCLWGTFNAPRPSQQIKPIEKPSGHHSIDAYLKQQGYKLGIQRAQLRSMTPMGFAYAFFAANQ
jgi:site-specific DNA-cytosine methylase